LEVYCHLVFPLDIASLPKIVPKCRARKHSRLKKRRL
jgi:hypothetical protein